MGSVGCVASGADNRLILTAYEVGEQADGSIRPASQRRDWMDETSNRFAYRCLPLVIANQAGWVILNRVDFVAFWNGGPSIADIQLGTPTGAPAPQQLQNWAKSHFGHGILTFFMPFLFRTSPGYNLWARGPINELKDGIQPLDGLVEADWLHAPFTMNWKFTRPFAKVHFRAGEPICQILPYPRGLIESIDPQIRPILDEPEIAAAYADWRSSRGDFLKDLGTPGSAARDRKWQKDYFQGRDALGGLREDHQTRLIVKDFTRAGPDAASS